MKVLLVGAFDESEIVLAPIKVGRELFRNLANKEIEVVFLCYFDDGSKYSRIQKLFGFENVNTRIYRCGIFSLIFFVIKYKPDIIQIVTPAAYYLPLFLLKSILKFKVTYLSHSIISYSLKNFLKIGCYQKLRLRTIERLVLKYSDSLQILSKVEARFLIKYLKVKNEKIRIVDNGINPSRIKKEYIVNSETIKIIFIGSLNRKEKSFDFLLAALKMVGTKGMIGCGTHAGTPTLLPNDLRAEWQANPPAVSIPRVAGGPFREWLRAIKGDGPEPGSNFTYAARLTEIILLGVLAQRFHTRIEWDATAGRITNHPELNAFVREPARKGWQYGENL